MFNASKGYGSSFDNDIWKPEGMSDALTSDQGMQGFVSDQLKAHDMQTRMAGDALTTFAETTAAKNAMEADLKAAEIYKEKQEAAQKSQSGGIGGIGKIAGGILGSVVGGPVGGAIGSGLGGAAGGLFG